MISSRHTLSDTFLTLESCVTKGKCVIKGKFKEIFPLVTHFSAQTCVTKGKNELNLQ